MILELHNSEISAFPFKREFFGIFKDKNPNMKVLRL